MWKVQTTEVFDEWFTGLGDDAKTEVIAKVELLKIFGPQLGRPHADTLKGSKHKNMKELRAVTADKAIRISFAFDPKRSAILLAAGDKGGVAQAQFYKKLIAKSDALFDAHLAVLKQRKEK
ncbi:MAG: type II toxin-antitoxin system RelE/ParE family toxin [Planctomycetota bacterium]